MTLDVVFRPQAKTRHSKSASGMSLGVFGLGREFGQELNGIVERIAAGPLHFPRVHRETRRAVMWRFPYAVYFRAIPAPYYLITFS